MRIAPKVQLGLAVVFTILNLLAAAIAWRGGEAIYGSIHLALAALGGWWAVWLRRRHVMM